jgi:hypothetical protein
MSFGFGFALPAYPLRGGGGNNPFNQSGPTLDLSFAGVVTDNTAPNGYTLTTNFITPQYQVAAQYTIWETGVGLVDKTFSQIITFTRASTGTFTGSNGLIQSAAIDAPRFDYDPVTLAAKGLLIEEQRTNLVTYSEQFGSWTNSGATVTDNTLLAPDGTTSADTIVRVGFTSDAIYNTATFTGDGVKAVSIWIKKGTSPSALIALLDATASVYRLWADVTWSGTTPSLAFTNGSLISSTNYGNGWWRLELATTAVTAANQNRVYVYPGRTGSVNGDTVYCWGAQAENATFATSYIPTVASQVTRSPDVASVNTLSPWYNATEGTLYVETGSAAGTSPRAATLHNGTIDAQIFHQINTSGFAGYNGAFQWQLSTVASVGKVAGAYKVNDIAASLNGGAVATDTSAVIPTGINQLRLGASWNGDGPLNGHIRRITYYPRRLSNAELQAITA